MLTAAELREGRLRGTTRRCSHRQLDEAKTVGVVGKVLESTPPRRLILTWARPNDADSSEKTSRVTFDIEPQANGLVKLTVLHEDPIPRCTEASQAVGRRSCPT